MTHEQLRLQMLSGLITESEYKAKLEENIDSNEALRQAEDLLNYPEGSFTDMETAIDKVEKEYFLHMWRKDPRKEPLLNWLNKYDPMGEHDSKESLNETKMNKETLRMQMLSGVITESEYKAKLKELGIRMSPRQIFRRSVVQKLNKIYNSVDNEELKLELMDVLNPTIDGIVERYGDDIGRYPMKTLLADLDDYLQSVAQPIIDKYSSKDSLNENFVGMGMVGNIFDREKTDYELAFEHFTKGTSLNENEDEMPEAPSHEETDANQVYENVGTTVDKVLSTFEFSEAGNDEMIEFAEYLLSPEGPKNIAMAIKNKLKGEGGEKYFTSNPEKLQSFLSKLR